MAMAVSPVSCERPPPPPAEQAATTTHKFCSTCHLFPPPDILPRSMWWKKVEAMYSIARGETEVEIKGFPPIETVVGHYKQEAPERLSPIDSSVAAGPGRLKLERRPLRIQGLDPYPGVTNVRFVHLTDRKRLQLLVCDMRFGMVLLMQPGPEGRVASAFKVGAVPHPCHAEVVDFDGDGHLDVLVANLGTVTPSDVENGSVEWLRGRGTTIFEKVTLAKDLGRVADVQAADFDGDGDLDLVVAVFGWRKVGEILYMENRTRDWKSPEFLFHVVDPRPGSIHVPVTDLNGDGRPDFIALISQHHETVVAYINQGQDLFEPFTIFQAPHPGWGSSGIDLLDFDGDGDLDVLFCNGDTLDDLMVKPYHGIQWLENRGEFPFVYHRLTDFYGAHFARAGDLDGDGDVDIIASSFLPFIRPDTPNADLVESIIWLEQVSPGKFTRHSIEATTTFHPTLDLGDVDGDGDLDVVVGNMTMAKRPTDTIDHWVMLLENRTR